MRELLFVGLLLGLAAIPAEEGYQEPSPEIRRAQWTAIARTAEAAERAIGQILRHEPALAAAIVVSAPVDTWTALRRTLVGWGLAIVPESQRAALRDFAALVCIARRVSCFWNGWTRSCEKAPAVLVGTSPQLRSVC